MTVLLEQASRAREKIWKVIRSLPEFTFDQVSLLSEEKASTYLSHLYSAGYLRQAGKRTEADGRRRVVWRLVRNTGPKAPMPCRCLYDPNIDGTAAMKTTSSAVIPASKARRESFRKAKKDSGPIPDSAGTRAGMTERRTETETDHVD